MSSIKKRLFSMGILSILTVLIFGSTTLATGTAPTVSYATGGTRNLIFVNNPEQITTSDLADKSYGGKSIYRDTLAQGKYRSFFEHLNSTSSTIGYAIKLYNPSSTSISATIHGSGYEVSIYGGKPFSQMLQNYSQTGTTYTIAANGTLYILRKDASVSSHTFFSGVIDFDISGSVIIDHIAYLTYSNIANPLQYEGYIQRIESDGTHEARMYKGMSQYSEAKASSINFTIDDSVKGVLPVMHDSYNLTAKSWTSPTLHNSGWHSNIAPYNNADAVHADMVTLYTPGYGNIDPFTASDGEGKYPNIGNWGVLYTVEGSVTNNGTFTRNLSVNLQACPTAGAAIAYKGSDGVWRDMKIAASSNVQYYTFTIPAGQTISYSASYVLGGPSGGDLVQSIAVNN